MSKSAILRLIVVILGVGLTSHAQVINPYRMVPNFGELPAGFKWGEVIGVEVDPTGNLYVLQRCSNGDGNGNGTCAGRTEPPILKFDPNGKFLQSWGVGMFVYPHGFHIDREGFLWATDARIAEGHGQQVYKFSPEGKLLLALGTAGVAGEANDKFNGPTDVAVAPNGDIYVADGHFGNNRVVRFSKDGTFIKAWGTRGAEKGQFNLPHTIAIDSQNRIFIGDRNNNRVQIFDADGKFLEEWKQFGRPSNIFISKDDTIYVTDSESNAERNPGWARGIRIGSAKDGSVRAFISNTDPEAVTTDAQGNVYAAIVTRRTLDKYAKR